MPAKILAVGGAPHVRSHRLDAETQAQARPCQLRFVEVVEQTRKLTTLLCDRRKDKLLVDAAHRPSPFDRFAVSRSLLPLQSQCDWGVTITTVVRTIYLVQNLTVRN